MSWDSLLHGKKNIVFLGESGCGKSELAMNLAFHFAKKEQEVHFFDMDQTKPLFRSRDAEEMLNREGIILHYEAQMADAPTMVGGVRAMLLDSDARVILDVGGGDIGARLIGGFSHLLRREETIVFYIVNPYRPWSGDLLSLDETLSAVLQAARIQKVHFLLNPNLGNDTTIFEFINGVKKGMDLLSPYVTVEGTAVTKHLAEQAKEYISIPMIPLQPMLFYPWDNM